MRIGRKINLHDSGNPTRIWLHAKDTANAVIKIIETGVVNEIYNISSNFEQSNIDTVQKVLKCYYGNVLNSFEDYIDFNFERPGGDLRYSIDDSKLRNLGWKPKANFDDELNEIVTYYKEHFIW